MGKITGFMDYSRWDVSEREPAQRVRNWEEFHLPLAEEAREEQGARCMNCGVPFCQAGIEDYPVPFGLRNIGVKSAHVFHLCFVLIGRCKNQVHRPQENQSHKRVNQHLLSLLYLSRCQFLFFLYLFFRFFLPVRFRCGNFIFHFFFFHCLTD